MKLDTNTIDIKESDILQFDEELLKVLLFDRSSNRNIIWATDNYVDLGEQFLPESYITIESVTGDYSNVIQPRIKKSKEVQEYRSKDKAEVFTPAWICNKQNNLIDNAFFGRECVFNTETEKGWIPTEKIEFLESENWRDYVRAKRLEITCGEAPYVVSRYDSTTGELIAPLDRVGILDRKFRVVHEVYGPDSDATFNKWFKWMKIALQATYGYEWQGDNLLIARENILLSFIDFYLLKCPNNFPSKKTLFEVAEIISWNFWQMDGIKMVIPGTCGEKEIVKIIPGDLFSEASEERMVLECEGCKTGDVHKHNGIQCVIKEWYNDNGNAVNKAKEIIPFHTLIGK